ncbi:MAG: hypothetical protein KA054_00350 [Candidatus Moranbacteria bacterium]|nr:hypothetical protein [Candidatus Moranbacteria bacterium]
MRTDTFPLQVKKGSVLAYVLVIMATCLILLTSIILFVVSQLQYSMKQHDREQALQIAEGGIHFYKWYLAHQLDGRTANQVQAFWSSGTALGQSAAHVVNYGNGQYSIMVVPPAAGSTIVNVTAVGSTLSNPGLTRTIKVRLRRPSWSESAVVSNDYVRFGAGTEVYGKIHSNSGIRFDGLAHNIVSSSLDRHNDPNHVGGDEFGVHTHVNVPPATGINNTFRAAEAPPSPMSNRTDVFEAGRQFPVATVDFNGILGDLSLMKSEAQAGRGKYFNNSGQGRRIILKSNGTYDICTIQSFNAATNDIIRYNRNVGGGTCVTCSGLCVSNYPIVDNGVIFVENNVWLEGTVDSKKITVVAANLISAALKTMYISRDIRYTHSDCSEIIGAIGQNDVEITRDSNDFLRIDAALIAQSGRVGRANYVGVNAIRDTITVTGAITSNQRYGFAWADAAGNHESGYINRNLYYDNNLLYCPPPYFPTGKNYLIDLWEEL